MANLYVRAVPPTDLNRNTEWFTYPGVWSTYILILFFSWLLVLSVFGCSPGMAWTVVHLSHFLGCEIAKGDVVLKSGELLGAAEVGLLATVGMTSAKVYPMPKVAELSTGDEQVEPATESLKCGQIRDSNRAMILAAAQQHQCEVLDLGIARDDEEDIERIFDRAFSSGIDILLTSGGVSMGDGISSNPCLKRVENYIFTRFA